VTPAALLIAFFLCDPPPGDMYRFPPYGELEAGRAFNWGYQLHLKWLLGYEGRDEWGSEVWLRDWRPYHASRIREALAEAEQLEEVWTNAIRAHPESPYTHTRSEHLRRLRLLIGPDAYRRAELPPCVPTWRFNQLRVP
jgi:hypothetical protein